MIKTSVQPNILVETKRLGGLWLLPDLITHLTFIILVAIELNRERSTFLLSLGVTLVHHPVAESCANTPGKMKNWLSLALKKKKKGPKYFSQNFKENYMF